MRETTVRGQYTAGFVQGNKVPGYLEEEGANKNSNTETFVSIRVDIDDWRWAGVPFYLRTGSAYPANALKLWFTLRTRTESLPRILSTTATKQTDNSFATGRRDRN